MTAVQLPGNWFELDDERCCYAMALLSLLLTRRDSIYCAHLYQSHRS